MIKQVEDFFGSSTSQLWPVRLYAEEWHVLEDYERWYIGVPEAMIGPMKPLLEATPYLGRAACAEDDGYLIYHTGIIEKEGGWPKERLQRELEWFAERYNMCLRFVSRGR